jgi:hypothetical protein
MELDAIARLLCGIQWFEEDDWVRNLPSFLHHFPISSLTLIEIALSPHERRDSHRRRQTSNPIGTM